MESMVTIQDGRDKATQIAHQRSRKIRRKQARDHYSHLRPFCHLIISTVGSWAPIPSPQKSFESVLNTISYSSCFCILCRNIKIFLQQQKMIQLFLSTSSSHYILQEVKYSMPSPGPYLSVLHLLMNLHVCRDNIFIRTLSCVFSPACAGRSHSSSSSYLCCVSSSLIHQGSRLSCFSTPDHSGFFYLAYLCVFLCLD